MVHESLPQVLNEYIWVSGVVFRYWLDVGFNIVSHFRSGDYLRINVPTYRFSIVMGVSILMARSWTSVFPFIWLLGSSLGSNLTLSNEILLLRLMELRLLL